MFPWDFTRDKLLELLSGKKDILYTTIDHFIHILLPMMYQDDFPDVQLVVMDSVEIGTAYHLQNR